MNYRATRNVLGLMRLIKSTTGLSEQHSLASYIDHWAAINSSPNVHAKICGHLSDVMAQSKAELSQSALPGEIMQALIATVDGLNMMVRYDQINGPITGHLVHIDNSIASFAIFVAMLPAEPMESEDDGLASLIADIEATAHSIAEFRLAPEVAELAKRHMAVLLLLLRTADAMGTDAALAAYAELIVRLRREKPQASEMGSPKQDFWDRITSWADRLTKWSDATEKGISLLGHASKAPELLSHIAL